MKFHIAFQTVEKVGQPQAENKNNAFPSEENSPVSGEMSAKQTKGARLREEKVGCEATRMRCYAENFI